MSLAILGVSEIELQNRVEPTVPSKIDPKLVFENVIFIYLEKNIILFERYIFLSNYDV